MKLQMLKSFTLEMVQLLTCLLEWMKSQMLLLMHVGPNYNFYPAKIDCQPNQYQSVSGWLPLLIGFIYIYATWILWKGVAEYSNWQLTAINYNCQTRNRPNLISGPYSKSSLLTVIQMHHNLKGTEWCHSLYWLFCLYYDTIGYTMYSMDSETKYGHPSNWTFNSKNIGIRLSVRFWSPAAETFSHSARKALMRSTTDVGLKAWRAVSVHCKVVRCSRFELFWGPVKIFQSQLGKPFLYGPCFVHRGMILLKLYCLHLFFDQQVWLNIFMHEIWGWG